MKTPPDKIIFMSKEWTIRADNTLCDEYAYTDVGMCDIRYNPNQLVSSQLQDTILHELLHAIDLTLHLRMSEGQIHAMAAGLYSLLRENPEFHTWLTTQHLEDRKNELF